MASSVFFKFKSSKEPTRVEFDGTGISVFELKREIILRSGLGDGTDFELVIYADDASKEGKLHHSSSPNRIVQRLIEIQFTTMIRRLSHDQPLLLPSACRPRSLAEAALLATSPAKCLYMQRIRQGENRPPKLWQRTNPAR